MKPTDLISRIEAVKAEYKEFAALDKSIAELWHAFAFFANKHLDEDVAATLAIAAVDNIMEEE